MPLYAKAALVALMCAVLISFSAAVASLIVMVQDDEDQGHCLDSGGRVEFYDAARRQAWRCVGARAEDPAQ